MTPHEFVTKWRGVELKERTASQSHFLDLCRLLDEPDPVAADPKGEWFTFEKGASKTSGGEGWADVWRRECFAWEYKGKRANLDSAFNQLLNYAIALDNPPLLIVSDMDLIRVHTNWTNTVQQVHTITLDDLLDGGKRDVLKAAFADPERLRPAKTRQMLTEEAAEKFAALAQRLRERGNQPDTVAHFVNRLVFCMFAEDVDLLPGKMFQRMLELCKDKPQDFEGHARKLFGAMNRKGGEVGFERVEWFNGGLFDTDEALPLEKADVADVLSAARLDWSDIDPSILGTLFERGLDPGKRSQLGAHYTDRDKIMLIVNPVIVEPLTAEWAETRGKIEKLIESAPKESKDRLLRGSELGKRTEALNKAKKLHQDFLTRLQNFRVLDPACGSGNFLYLSLLALKDLEHKANLEAEALGLPRGFPTVGPECVKGIEINPYAAELARVSVWIGEIQWMRRNGFEAARNPILRPLGTIECRDAILNEDGTRAEWPKADVVVGNPPFLGGKFLRKGRPATKTKPALEGLGDNYVEQLFDAYGGKPPRSADLVVYWLARAVTLLRMEEISRFGLVATKSIAKGASNRPLMEISEQKNLAIYEAWTNEEWVVDGAAVRVAMVCCSKVREYSSYRLNGKTAERINPDLTSGFDITRSERLIQNGKRAFQGVKLNGPFNLSPQEARNLLVQPTNPNGRRNSLVVRKFIENDDVTLRPQDGWVLDFTDYPSYADAVLFENPFKITNRVKNYRDRLATGTATETDRLDKYWLMQRPREKLRAALFGLNKVILTPETSEHRIFSIASSDSVFSGSIFIITRDDLTCFGVLHSHVHKTWAIGQGNRLGAGNQSRYNVTRTFGTFPFPEGLTPDIPAADYADDPRAIKIAEAAARLNELRENWLNPPDLVKRVPEVVPGYPDRILPVSDEAEKILKKRTLTNLYNDCPAWLDHAHATLDEAVAEAYGWGDDWRAGKLDEDEILARLFHLNQERAAAQG